MVIKGMPAEFGGTFNPTKKLNDPIDNDEIFGQVFFSGVWNDQDSSSAGTVTYIRPKGIVKVGAILCRVDDTELGFVDIRKSRPTAKKKKAKKKGAKKKPAHKKKVVRKKTIQKKKAMPLKKKPIRRKSVSGKKSG
jgi:hypothetical protein